MVNVQEEFRELGFEEKTGFVGIFEKKFRIPFGTAEIRGSYDEAEGKYKLEIPALPEIGAEVGIERIMQDELEAYMKGDVEKALQTAKEKLQLPEAMYLGEPFAMIHFYLRPALRGDTLKELYDTYIKALSTIGVIRGPI